MTRPGWWRRPARQQPLLLGALALGCLVAVIAAILISAPHSTPRQRTVAVSTPAAPSAVIGTRPAPPTLTAGQLSQVRQVARAFLASYLPVLYGRRAARTITHAAPRVRAELTAATRTPRAPRDRRPRTTRLTTHVQSRSTVVAVARVDDSVTQPFQIVIQLSDGRGGWQVTQLANY